MITSKNTKFSAAALTTVLALTGAGVAPTAVYANDAVTQTMSITETQPTQALTAAATATAGTPVSIQNGDFQTFTGTNGVADGWNSYVPPTATATFTKTSYGFTGNAQSINASDLPAGKYANISQTIAAEPNTHYVIDGKFWVNSLTNANVQLYVDFYDASGNRLDGYSVTRGSMTFDWFDMNLTRKSPVGTASMRVYAILRATADGGSGSVKIDNIKVRKMPTALVNGNFETFARNDSPADGWVSNEEPKYMYYFIEATTLRSEGNLAQSFYKKTLGYNHLSQLVAVDPNTDYTLTGMFQTRLVNGKGQLYVDYYNAAGTWLRGKAVDAVGSTNGQFVQLTNRSTSPSDASYMKVYVVMRSLNNEYSTGSMVVDDIQLRKGL